MDDIEELQVAILNLNGRTSTYAESVPVHEEFQGETVWEGEGEVLTLKGTRKPHALTHWDTRPGKRIKRGAMIPCWNCLQ